VDFRLGLGDAPRVEVALPKDPADPMLRDWVQLTMGGGVTQTPPRTFHH
jgi:hypothetical protein